MPKRPNKTQLEQMRKIARSTLDPVKAVESLLNDDPKLKDLQKELIDKGIVMEVDEEGRPLNPTARR